MTYEPAVIVAIIIGLSEILKGLKISTKYIPIFNVIVGVGILLLVGLPITEAILTGMIIGLTASGLYDLVGKPIREKLIKGNEEEEIN